LQLDDGSDAALGLPVPWASIALALFLTAFGITSFVLAWLHFTQKVLGKERAVSFGVQTMCVAGKVFLGLVPKATVCTGDQNLHTEVPLGKKQAMSFDVLNTHVSGSLRRALTMLFFAVLQFMHKLPKTRATFDS
jgi:hypothetical protein